MTVEEIFTTLAAHMTEGLSYHEEMAKAYDFLGLWGLAAYQTHQYLEEAYSYRRFCHYYATHYFKLLQFEPARKPPIIPESWYKYTAQAVDNGTKKSAIKELMTKWADWERSTKKLYQEMRHELLTLKEADAARKLDERIHDVSTELHDIEKYIIWLEAINYDLIEVSNWSHELKKKYKKGG